MQNLLTNKTVFLIELRDLAKVLEKAGSKPIAVLHQNKVVGYFVPEAAVEDIKVKKASLDERKGPFVDRTNECSPRWTTCSTDSAIYVDRGSTICMANEGELVGLAVDKSLSGYCSCGKPFELRV